MSDGGQSYHRFRTARSSDEWMMRVGEADKSPILFVPPLFEELNRTRALIVTIMRALAADDFGCWLPDLCGTSESELPLSGVAWGDWRDDVMAAADHVVLQSGQAPLVATIRGGCLIDDAAKGIGFWRFAPVAGKSLVRDMDRASLGGGAEWAGYHDAGSDLREAVSAAEPADVSPLRSVRLATDAGSANHKVEGPALWRRSEPGSSAELAATLALDIAAWRRECAGS